jgi:hypothetical protein
MNPATPVTKTPIESSFGRGLPQISDRYLRFEFHIT